MLLVAMIVISLMSIPAHEASRIFHGEQKMMKQNQLLVSLHGQVPSPTTIQKAFAGHNVSPLLRRLLRAYVPPPAPNPPKSRLQQQHTTLLLNLHPLRNPLH